MSTAPFVKPYFMDINYSLGTSLCFSVDCLLHIMEECNKKVGEEVGVASPASSAPSAVAALDVPKVDMHTEEVDQKRAD